MLALTLLAAPATARPGYVRSDGASVRAKPSAKGKVLERLPYGAQLEVLGPKKGNLKDTLHCAPASGPWVKAKTAAGKVGWVWQPLLQDAAPASTGGLKAVVAFRGQEEARYGAFSDLFGDLGARCKAAGVEFVVADPAAPCVKLGPKDAPLASVDVTRSLEAQGQGFILKVSGEDSRFLTPQRKNHAELYRFCGAEPPKAQPLTGAARMLHLDPVKWACAWNVYDLDSGKVRTAYTSEKCPEEIIWDTRQGTVTYHVDSDWFRGPWPAGEAKLLAKPPLPTGGWIGPTGIGAENGRLRVIYVVPAEARVEDGVKHYVAGAVKLAMDAITDGGDTFFMVKGTWAPKGTEEERIMLPDWGAPSIATLVEEDGKGGWRQLAQVPTMCEAGEVPCASLLEPWLKRGPGIIHSEDLKVACNDGRTDCMANTAIAEDPAMAKAVGMTADDADAGGSVGFFSWGKGALVFPVAMGDTPHAMGPVLACAAPDCKTRRPLELGRQQSDGLSLGVRGRYLMVSGEYRQGDPALFRDDETKPFLRLRGFGFWLPEAFPPVE